MHTVRLVLAPLAGTLLLAGCAAGAADKGRAPASLTGHHAATETVVQEAAVSRAARARLIVIHHAAQAWAAESGGVMTGFAAGLRSTRPAVVRDAVALTDTSVTVATGSGTCLVAQLPAGGTVTTAC